MKTIKQTYLINASLSKVWQALVDPKIINDWGGGLAKMSDKEGEEFSLWGGDIHGKNIAVVPNNKLVQAWKEKDWKDYSKVTFILREEGDKTKVELLHEDVPDSSAKAIENGWKEYYLGPLKTLLETS